MTDRRSQELIVEGVTVHFGGVRALDNVSFSVATGESVAIVGPNGAGKTTLFDVISGFVPPSAGIAKLGDAALTAQSPWRIARAGVTRSFQEIRLINEMSTLNNLIFSFLGHPGESLLNTLVRRDQTLAAESNYRELAVSLLKRGGLDEKAGLPAGALSYGQQKMLSILCCFGPGKRLVLLDEPIAGLAPAFVERAFALINYLRANQRTILMIEHNFSFVSRTCHRMIFLDAGRKLLDGPPDKMRSDRNLTAVWLGRHELNT